MSILEKLIGRKKVEEFDAALNEIEEEIEAKQARAIELRGQVAAAAFDAGPERVRELQREARDLDDEIIVLQAVSVETLKRREQADTNFRREGVDKRMATAEKDRQALIREWTAFEEQVRALREAVGRMQELSESIRIGNEFARINGFSDLQFRLPGTNFQGLISGLDALGKQGQSAIFEEQRRSGRIRIG